MDRRLWIVLLAALALTAGCLGGDETEGTDEAPEDGANEEQDPSRGGENELAWTQRPNVPTARTEVATAILDGELYVIGGFGENLDPSPVVEVLDLEADEWREGPPLPVPLHHARAVAIEGAVHVFGGYNAVPFQATPTHLVLEPGASTWSQAPPLPTARGGHGAAASNGSVYLVGGVGPDGELLSEVDVYHPGNGSYTQALDLPTPRDHLAVAASPNWIHAVGGREQSLDSNTAKHEVLVPGQEWVEAAPMPTARGGIDAASLGGTIVVAGGEGPDGTFAEVEAWDPARDWTALPELPTPRHGLGVDAHEGELLTTAGGPEPGLTTSDVVEVLSPANDGDGGDEAGNGSAMLGLERTRR